MELSQAAARALMRCRPFSLYASPIYRPQLLRSFTTTRLLRQDQPEAFIRQLKKQEQDQQDKSFVATQDAAAAAPSQQPRNESESINDMLDSVLDGTKGVPTVAEHRSSHFASSKAQESNRVQPASSPASSLDDFQQFRRPAPRSSASVLDFNDAFSRRPGLARTINPVRELDFTPSPTLGKTVEVRNGGDVGRAFRQVEALCSRNRVRQDFNKQRFHERPGLKRKRLHSERWRRRFKEAFRGTVKMVNKMRKQGW